MIHVLLALWVVSELVLSLRKRAAKARRRKGRRGSALILWIVIFLSMVAANLAQFLSPWRIPGSASLHTTITGALLILGSGVRWAAIVTLGRFFSVDVAVQEGHRIVSQGPYRWIRHPSYTGLLMCFLGVGFAFGNWLGLALLIVPITAGFLYRIRIEEGALSEEFGESYSEYRAGTKRLVPGLY